MKHQADSWKPVNCVREGEVTCIGTMWKEFPYPSGNCFSLIDENSNIYRILNFNHENFKELFRIGVLSYPVKVLAMTEHQAVLHDSRIPEEWYSKRFCEICTPSFLLPVNQRLEQLREVDRGDREEKNGFISRKIRAGQRQLKGTWSFECDTESDVEISGFAADVLASILKDKMK